MTDVLPLAHGLTGKASDYSTLQFIPLGIEHMALGWDHLLFILGAILLAGEPRRAAKVVSAFVLGHSLTLGIATFAEWRLDTTFVDTVIALSVAYIGVVAWRGRPTNWRPVFATVFGFGLVHGLGLSTRLQEAGVPDDGLFVKTLAFNVGIEFGQLAVIAVVLGVGRLVLTFVRRRPAGALRHAGAALIAIGLAAAAILSFPAQQDDTEAADRRGDSCAETEVDPPVFAGGGHPKEKFQRPGAPVVDTDIVHVLTDGFVVLRYRPDLPATEVDALERYVTEDDRAIVGAPDPEQDEPVRAVTAYRELRCNAVEMPTIEKFADQWLDDIKNGRVK